MPDLPQRREAPPVPPTLEEAWTLLGALWPAVQELRAENAALRERVRELEARLGQDSSNSSRPPSSDPPQAKRRPPAPPSGRARGGQPGHVAHQRALVPAERVDQVVEHRPTTCAHCAAPLPVAGRSDGPDYLRHQVTEVPPVRAVVTEHRCGRW